MLGGGKSRLMKKFTYPLTFIYLVLTTTSWVLAAGKVAGRLYDPGGSGWKEFFVWYYPNGGESGSGDYTDMGGFWQNSNMAPGLYTFGLSRMYDLGPVIKPNVLVEEGKTTRITMIWPADYWVDADTNKISDPHKSFAQCWVSRGGSILWAQFHLVKEGDTLPEVTYTIHEGGPTGKQIGPASKNGWWKHGEVVTEHGKTYCLVATSDKPFKVYLGQEKDLQGDVYFDGQKQEKTVIGGRIKLDRDGLITQRFAWPGVGAQFSGPCQRTIGQTFTAKGTGLAMFDFTFLVGAGRVTGLGSTVRVLEGGPGGKQVGTAKYIKHMWDGHLRNHIWARGECPLTPGKTYYIEITAENGPFQVLRVKDELPGGEMYMDGKPLPEYDIDTCLIEYEEDNSPPPPVKAVTIDSAGNAYQITFDTPQDMDCSMVDIRRVEGDADPMRSKPITRLYVSADQTYVYVDRDVKPGKKYRYALTMLDESENQSQPIIVEATPLTATTESNLLVNGNFIVREQGGGGIAPGWETMFVHGGAATFTGGPREEKLPGGSIWFWNKYARYDCVFYQQVPAKKGSSYKFSAYAKVNEPWHNGNVNEISFVGIDPLGRLDPTAPEVVWSAPNYTPGQWVQQSVWATADSNTITVYLRARSMYHGYGMEAGFCEAKLTEIKKPTEIKPTVIAMPLELPKPSDTGELIIDWAYNWGNFNDAVYASQHKFPWNWYEHDDRGTAYVRNLKPGYYTIGVGRAFGLGPTVQPNVWVSGDRPTHVTIDYLFDYFAEPSDKTIKAKTISQPFFGKGVSVIKAGFFFKEPFPKKSVQYSIHEGSPNGPQVGPTSNALDDAIGSIGSWVHGDIPLKQGQLYYLTCEIHHPDAQPFLAKSADPNAILYVDGKPMVGMAIAGFIQSDPPGLFTNLTSPAGMKDNEEGRRYVQSLVAKGTSLALIDFVPWFEAELPDGSKTDEFEIHVSIRSTVQGDAHNTRVVKCKNGCVSQLVFAPGEVPLTPGQPYVIQLDNPAGRPFKINWTWQLYNSGCLWRDNKPIDYWEADMNVLEYGPTQAEPPSPSLTCYSGTGFTRLEYTAPKIPGVTKLQIRYRDDWFGTDEMKLQDKLLAELDVTPGQYGVIHDYGLPINSSRHYIAYAIDYQGNISKAESEGSYVGYGPILPPDKAVANMDFAIPGSWGGPPACWEYKVLQGNARFSNKLGSLEWSSDVESDVIVYQTITLTPGRTYRISVKATGQSAMIGIGPGDLIAPDANGVVWSSGEPKLVVTVTKPANTLFLRGKGKGTFAFSQLNVEDITHQ
jgi:hypothetical protein